MVVASAFCGNNVYSVNGIQPDLLSLSTALQGNIGGNSTKRVLYESVSGEVMLQNQDNMNVCIILYGIIARKESGLSDQSD